jgi:hypothetical protein
VNIELGSGHHLNSFYEHGQVNARLSSVTKRTDVTSPCCKTVENFSQKKGDPFYSGTPDEYNVTQLLL